MEGGDTFSMLSRMVEVCEDLDKKPVLNQEEYQELRNQVLRGKLIFDSIVLGDIGSRIPEIQPASQSDNCGRTQGNDADRTKVDTPSSQVAGCSQRKKSFWSALSEPREMLVFLKHTKLCASILRRRVERMGEGENIFSLDLFLAAVRNSGGQNEIGGYSFRAASRELCEETAFAFKTVPGIPCFVGALNHNEYMSEFKEQPRKPDAEKKRRTRTTKVFDTNVSVHEQLDASQRNKEFPDGKDGSFFRNVLRQHCKDTGVSEVGLTDFCINKDSVYQSAQNIYETSFGVRDGRISLDASATGTITDIKVSPARFKKRIQPKNRSQCIVSFSAADIRKLMQAAEGENVIERQCKPTEKSPD